MPDPPGDNKREYKKQTSLRSWRQSKDVINTVSCSHKKESLMTEVMRPCRAEPETLSVLLAGLVMGAGIAGILVQAVQRLRAGGREKELSRIDVLRFRAVAGP